MYSDMYSKEKFSIAIFLPRVFRWGTNREIKSRRLGTIVTSFQDFKLRENRFSDIFLLSYKQRTIVPFFSELISSRYENDWEICFSRSLKSWNDITIIPVSYFWSRGFVPHRKWNLTLLVHQNTGKENCYRKFFFAIHISTLRRFNRANKKNLSYTLLRLQCLQFTLRLLYVPAKYETLAVA